MDALLDETKAQILEGSNAPVHFSLEYLGPSLSITDQISRKKLVSLLQAKHAKRSFDLVVTIGDDMLEFARAARANLFPGAAIVFFVMRPENAIDNLIREPGVTGVIRKLDYPPTLKLAQSQNPGTRHLIVVCGSSDSEKLEIKVAQEQFRPYESDIDIQYWAGLEFSDLDARLASVPPDSVVLFLNFLADPEGREFTPTRVLRTLAAGMNRPIYGTFLSFVGAGIIGGKVADLREVGQVLGRSGLRVLKGERAETIPITTGEFQRYAFDWRQLHHWRIPQDQIPPGSSVLFWEQSPWVLYRWRIVGLALLAVAQALLIVLLLAGRTKLKRIENALRRKEEHLKKSEEKFSKLFRQGPLGVSLTSAITHRYIDVNETFERMVGYGREELIGRTVLEVGIWKDLNQRLRATKQLLSEGRLRDVEFSFRKKSGEVRVALASAELIEIGGEPCALGAVIDITDRKRAEQAVVESEKRFRLLADSAPVLMWLSGPDRLRTDFNEGWLQFTGRSMQEELGEGWMSNVHPDDLRAFLDAYDRAFGARQQFAIEYRLRRHDGQHRWILDCGEPRFLENGEFAGYIGSCIDLTDQKEVKAAREDLSGRLIHAQEEERARIARELHDDINQRLALLANGLDELRIPVTDGAETKLEQQVESLWQLTNEIASDIQHLSHQLHPSKLQYLGLAASIREVCQEFARQHKVETECIVRDLPKDLDDNVSLSLFRIVQESLHNIAKHSHAHHVKVELTHQSRKIRLRISDDGVGFNSGQTMDHGLGLVSMRERVRSAGGDFSISSRPSRGTQVEATIPATVKSLRIA